MKKVTRKRGHQVCPGCEESIQPTEFTEDGFCLMCLTDFTPVQRNRIKAAYGPFGLADPGPGENLKFF